MSVSANMYPVDYTSRDYLAIRQDLINVLQSRIPEWQADDPSDFGVALVEAFAYIGDVINYYIDRAAAETFLGTASLRQSVLNIAGLLGYSPSGRIAAQVPLLFTNVGTTDAQVINGAQLRTVLRSGDVNTPLTFEVNDTTNGYYTVPANGGSLLIPVTEGTTVSNTLGVSNGFAGQTFTIRDTPLINRSLTISVGSSSATAVPYTYVQNLYQATSSDKMFTYSTDDSGVTTVTFGDGVAGAVPPSGQNVYATYRLGGGIIGNISQGQTFAPVGWSFTGTITNQIQATGGVDEETTDHIRQAAFTAFRTRNNAVTKQDFEDIAQSDNRISKAKGRGNSFGNMMVYVAPVSSGDPQEDPQPGYDAYNVISRSLTSNVVTLTLADTPQFSTGQSVTVSGMGAPWDGTFTVTVGSSNTITYSVTSANQGQTSCSGIVSTGELSDFATTRSDIQTTLQSRGVIGTIVTVYPPQYLDIKLAVEVGIKSQFRQTAAVASVKSALQSLFNYNNVPFNLSIRPQDILAYLVTSVPEISFATVSLYNAPDATTTSDLVQAASDQIMRLLDSNLSITVNSAATGILA